MLLLLLVTAGLFTMHTMGHSFPAGHRMIEAHSVAITVPATPMSPMDATDLCVAILVGVAVVLVAVVILHRMRSEANQRHPARVNLDRPGRGPPIVQIGLTITNLSEMRN